MKRIIILSLVLPLIACDKAPEVQQSTGAATPADFTTVMNEMQKADRHILAGGDQGDFLIKIENTDAIKDVASRDKNAKFLSIDNPKQYIEDGFCLLNIIPKVTIEKMGNPDSRCHYRLFCGDTMNYDEYYAVELCKE